MKVSEAIRILTFHNYEGQIAKDPDFANAINLSIESLKRLYEQRLQPFSRQEPLLPGETPND